MLAAIFAVADGCCASGSWMCSCFPCDCWTCCCIYGVASGAVLLTVLGVVRALRHPKVVVVGPKGGARERLVSLLEASDYRVEVKDGRGGLSVLETGGEIWTLGPVQIDMARSVVTRADGTEERLLPRELKIVGLLATDPGVIVTRDTLMNEAWGLNYYGTTRTVDQTIANLRKKLGTGVDIQSVRGEGYRLMVQSAHVRDSSSTDRHAAR